MDVIPIKPERRAELEEYAQRHGQDAAAVLDEALAEYLEWERLDYEESVEAIRRGYEDMKAGRTRPAAEFLEELGVAVAAKRPSLWTFAKREKTGPAERQANHTSVHDKHQTVE